MGQTCSQEPLRMGFLWLVKEGEARRIQASGSEHGGAAWQGRGSNSLLTAGREVGTSVLPP